MNVTLIVWMFWLGASGHTHRERHEYPFPSPASCEETRDAVMEHWRGIAVAGQPQGVATWCREEPTS